VGLETNHSHLQGGKQAALVAVLGVIAPFSGSWFIDAAVTLKFTNQAQTDLAALSAAGRTSQTTTVPNITPQ